MLQAEYPSYWPETIRGLLEHSAKWTEAMKARFLPLNKKVIVRSYYDIAGLACRI
jgi:hypothetical protein